MSCSDPQPMSKVELHALLGHCEKIAADNDFFPRDYSSITGRECVSQILKHWESMIDSSVVADTSSVDKLLLALWERELRLQIKGNVELTPSSMYRDIVHLSWINRAMEGVEKNGGNVDEVILNADLPDSTVAVLRRTLENGEYANRWLIEQRIQEIEDALTRAPVLPQSNPIMRKARGEWKPHDLISPH